MCDVSLLPLEHYVVSRPQRSQMLVASACFCDRHPFVRSFVRALVRSVFARKAMEFTSSVGFV